MALGPHRTLALQAIAGRRTEIAAELAALTKMEYALGTLSTGDDISALVAITAEIVGDEQQRLALVMFGVGIREPFS